MLGARSPATTERTPAVCTTRHGLTVLLQVIDSWSRGTASASGCDRLQSQRVLAVALQTQYVRVIRQQCRPVADGNDPNAAIDAPLHATGLQKHVHSACSFVHDGECRTMKQQSRKACHQVSWHPTINRDIQVTQRNLFFAVWRTTM